MLRKYDHTIFSVCPRIFPTAQARKKEDGHTTLNPQISAIFTPLPVIKHTIHGDANITDDDKAIKEIMNQNFDIKR